MTDSMAPELIATVQRHSSLPVMHPQPHGYKPSLALRRFARLFPTRTIASSLSFGCWRLSALAVSASSMRLEHRFLSTLRKALMNMLMKAFADSGESELSDVLIATWSASALFSENCGDETSAKSWNVGRSQTTSAPSSRRRSRRRRWPGCFPVVWMAARRPRRAWKQQICHKTRRRGLRMLAPGANRTLSG